MPEFSSILELSSLDGRNGFKMSGEVAFDFAGRSVASAGDINGDGFADVITGANGVDPNGDWSGASYVVFGKAQGFPAEQQLSSLNGANGFQISGEAAEDFSGWSVASAGDINGDGFADAIIAAPQADPNGSSSGASYVVFGKAGGFAANLQLSSLNGANGFQISGEAQYDRSGESVASAGDVNGDGFDDLIIGSGDAYTHTCHVVFGKAAGFGSNLQLSSLDGTNGFKINDQGTPLFTGYTVASAGDFNGDGFADLILGAYGGETVSYVVFGKAGGFTASLRLSNLNGANGFSINREPGTDYSGRSVASAGDINGDGFADAIVGANNGTSYVVFGRAGGFASSLQLSSLNGANGFKIISEASGDASGWSVASAGDVNGDGFDDVIIGGAFSDWIGRDSGITHVVFGKAGGFRANLELSRLDGSNGFRIAPEQTRDFSGWSVAPAGDVNGDGFADMMVGALMADPNGDRSGASYVVFGHRAFDDVRRIGTVRDDTINGGTGDDTIRGLGGNDRLIAWEGNDLVYGNGGRDRLIGRGGNDRLVGGLGRDVLIGGPGSDVFDFNAVTDSGSTEDSRDVIRDFVHLEDKIDLSDLGALAFIGTAAFTAPGQVRVVQQGPNTIVEINLSGDAAPEMTIALLDVAATTLTAQDFIL